MKAIKNSVPIHFENGRFLKDAISSFLVRDLCIDWNDFAIIGSFGKKEHSSDIDIAVIRDFNNIDDIKNVLNSFGIEFKIFPGFHELSFGFPLNGKIYQVDLMFTKNLDWSEFIYYSPNLINGESKYKGIYRNLLLSAILITESRFVVDENNCKQMILRLNEGLFRVHKSFIDIFGKKVNFSRIVEEQFLTNDPMTFTKILNLGGPCLTFEQVFEQIKNRPKYQEIIERFIKFCNKSKIEIPSEIELWEQQNK